MRRNLARLFALLILAALPVWAADPPLESLVESGHWKRLRAMAEPRLAANPNDAEAAYLLSRVKLA